MKEHNRFTVKFTRENGELVTLNEKEYCEEFPEDGKLAIERYNYIISEEGQEEAKRMEEIFFNMKPNV